MKKLIVFMVVCMMMWACGTAFAVDAGGTYINDECPIWGIAWGDTVEQVIAVFGGGRIVDRGESLTSLSYGDSKYGSYLATYVFYFFDDRLCEVCMLIRADIVAVGKDGMERFENGYSNALMLKYGEPITTDFDNMVNGTFNVVDDGDYYFWMVGDHVGLYANVMFGMADIRFKIMDLGL